MTKFKFAWWEVLVIMLGTALILAVLGGALYVLVWFALEALMAVASGLHAIAARSQLLALAVWLCMVSVVWAALGEMVE